MEHRLLGRIGVSVSKLCLHRYEPNIEIEETLGALTDLVHQGKLRYIGSSTFPASAIVEAQWAARDRLVERYDLSLPANQRKLACSTASTRSSRPAPTSTPPMAGGSAPPFSQPRDGASSRGSPKAEGGHAQAHLWFRVMDAHGAEAETD